MNQQDFFGGGGLKSRSYTVGNKRPSVAEEKASLALDIKKACSVVPPSVVNGSYEKVRDWKRSIDSAMKVAGKVNSTTTELTAALADVRRASA